MKKSDFAFHLPDELIAQYPLPERGASRLLCLNKSTGLIEDKQFSDFIGLLKPNDLLVFNDTKVIPARLFGNKQSGGKVEILIERILDAKTAVAHVKASKSPRPGTEITLANGYACTVLDREDDLFRLAFQGSDGILAILENIGHIPLPPYIHRDDEQSDFSRYQSVFAREAGAVAAPTASLHFDQKMLDAITASGIQTAFVTLHVGSGTFQPVRVEDLAKHRMHAEYFAVNQDVADKVLLAKSRGGRVIAIGTTAIRALESAAASGRLVAGFGDTRLFITPGYQFKVVDACLTNFHLPESTLLMLIAALAGYEPVMAAYAHAIAASYRFFSYGDAMFIGE
jgi:S-adenosylmethionine:tRNA ribosyltransferase-isomerase